MNLRVLTEMYVLFQTTHQRDDDADVRIEHEAKGVQFVAVVEPVCPRRTRRRRGRGESPGSASLTSPASSR